MDIIRPRAVVALGQKVSEAILDAYHISRPTSGGLKALLRASPFQITSTTALFPLYHCGAGSVNRNRNMDEQIADWRKMAESLSKG